MSGRKKTAKQIDLKPWLSANWDNRDGRFIQVGNSLPLSKEFQSLGFGARWLYMCMAMESGGNRTFTFPHLAAKKYGFSSTSFERQTKELIEKGFIKLLDNPDHEQFKANQYSFSFEWKSLKPAPHFGEGKK